MNSLLLTTAMSILSCGTNESSKQAMGNDSPGAVTVPVQTKFDGSFEGTANNIKYELDISNKDDSVSGTMKDSSNSFPLSGRVSNERLSGVLKYELGSLPFEAHYEGPGIVLQLYPATIKALKALAELSPQNSKALVGEDKIVFNKMQP